jgi:two-component sensor histidine kinase|uniref:histidine kinase n=1 Tax=Rhodopseudomonas palustris (strain BisA53) TaxID=316055 RepID=Q07NZ3_RHOP5
MSIQATSSDQGNSVPFNLRGESDYRIAKSLTMISGMIRLRAFRGDLVDPQAVLLEIADRIDAVGALHSLLADSISGTVQLSAYLEEICLRGMRALSSCPVELSVTCRPEHVVPFRVALPLGLITAELFSNSVKHAHPADASSKVTIICSRPSTDTLRYVYQDDGIGLPEDFDCVRDGHLGMRLIQSLSERIRGTHLWSSSPRGIRFELALPMGD